MAKLKYDENFPERAGEYAAKGLNNREIAAQLGISEDTFYVYQRQFPEFAEAIDLGRRVLEDKAAGCLMKLAMGDCFVVTVKRSASGRETKTVRRLAPDLKAIIRWLERNKQYADDGEKPAESQISMNIPANLKYAADFPEDAETYAGNGDTDTQIAKRLGISPASFYNYKKQFPEFAVALDCGRRECYGRLRGQLLAIALGKCSVTIDTYRGGELCKTTERQLPPNLKAIKYWLETAKREVRIQESEFRMGAMESEDWSQKSSAQELSKHSETGGCPAGYAGRMGETASAQELSKHSESASAAYSQAVKASAQRLSKMSRKERQRLLKNRRETRRD